MNIKKLNTPYQLRNNRDSTNGTTNIAGGSASSSGSWLEKYITYDADNNALDFITNLSSEGEITAWKEGNTPLSIWDSMPIATDNVLGGIMIGTGLSIDENGILSTTATGTGTTQTLDLTADILSISDGNNIDLSGYNTVLTGYALESWVNNNFAASSHTHSYDNYNGWDLQVNSGSVNRISTGENVNFVQSGATDVSISGSTVTISSTDTNTWRSIDNTPVNGVTSQSISSNWAFDHTANSSAHPRDTRSQILGTYNTIIGTDSDINTSGNIILDNIYVTDGVITSMGTRTLSASDINARPDSWTPTLDNVTDTGASTTNGISVGELTVNGTKGDLGKGLSLFPNDVSIWGKTTDGTKQRIMFIGSDDNTYFEYDTGQSFNIREKGNLRFTLSSGGSGTFTGEVTAYSDRRIKDNLKVIPNALDKVDSLTGYTYNRVDIDSNKRYAGVIAQEVHEVLPEAITVQEDSKNTLSINDSAVTGLLVEAIKELRLEVNELKQQVKDLRNG